MFSVSNQGQRAQVGEIPWDVCLAWSLTPDDEQALFAAVISEASPLETWSPHSEQEKLEARVLSALCLLAPTSDAGGSFHLTPLGLRVAMARIVIIETLMADVSSLPPNTL